MEGKRSAKSKEARVKEDELVVQVLDEEDAVDVGGELDGGHFGE
jgi:hypothetical protein